MNYSPPPPQQRNDEGRGKHSNHTAAPSEVKRQTSKQINREKNAGGALGSVTLAIRTNTPPPTTLPRVCTEPPPYTPWIRGEVNDSTTSKMTTWRYPFQGQREPVMLTALSPARAAPCRHRPSRGPCVCVCM